MLQINVYVKIVHISEGWICSCSDVESTHTLEAAIGTPPPSKPIAAETPKSSISGLRGMATPMRKMKRFYNGLCSPAAIGWLCSPTMLAAESGTSHPPANTEVSS